MSHWYESGEIVAALAGLEKSGGRAALATVVAIEGSTYRRPGAKLLVRDAGAEIGGVSGGCLEGDVREAARAVLASGGPELRTYDSRSDDDRLWGLGLGCDGRVDVWIAPALPGAWSGLLAPFAEALSRDAPFALVTPLGGGAPFLVTDGELVARDPAVAPEALVAALRAQAFAGAPAIVDIGLGRLFVERFAPPAPLIVCGAGDDSRPLVRLATLAGFRVWLVDHREALLSRERFPEAYRLLFARPDAPVLELPSSASAAIVKLHSYAHDRDWAQRLLAAELPFVGLLGPRARRERIEREIGAGGDVRLVGPVGLDLGAYGADEIAVSIVAQLLALRAGRTAGPLAFRREAIHAG